MAAVHHSRPSLSVLGSAPATNEIKGVPPPTNRSHYSWFRWRLRVLTWRPITAVVIFAVLGLAANWPTWPGDPSRLRAFDYGGLGAGDLYQMAWFLAWTPYALIHGHNIFFTTSLNYPGGVNLAQNQSSPLLGLLTAPLTLLVNPVASTNLLLWLAFPLSASSMFFVLRRWVKWDVAAFAGGALYGFSPYIVDQSLYHLDLAFVPLPPLILLATYELLHPTQKRPRRWGVALGVLLVAQFFISPEMCATTVMIAVVAAVFLAISAPREILNTVTQAASGLTAAVVIVGAGIAYPVSIMLAGPYRYSGPAYPTSSADLLGTVVPTSMQRYAFGSLVAEGNKLVMGNTTENGSYLGVPLLILTAAIVVICWRARWVRFAALMIVATIVLALGPHLVVANHVTSIPLPFDVLQRLPLMDNVLTVRLALYTAIFASLLVALGMDDMHTRALLRHEGHLTVDRQSWGFPAATGKWPLGVLGILCIVSLIPRWPFPTSSAGVPTYFVTKSVNRVPANSVVLISPYPSIYDAQPQLWQAMAKMRFSIIGGYGLFAGPTGTSSNFPETLGPQDVQSYLWDATYGGNVPYANARLDCDVSAFLLDQHVGTVLVSSIAPTSVSNPHAIMLLFTFALGKPSTVDGSITAWYNVQRDISNTNSCDSH